MPVCLARRLLRGSHLCYFATAFAALALSGSAAEPNWDDIREQNRLLKAQLESQQHQLDELRSEIKELSGHSAASGNEPAERADGNRRIALSGEVGLAFFSEGRNGQYPNDEFRVDDAVLRVEAPIVSNVYFYGELQLARREGLDENFHLGEFYLEYENLSGALGWSDRLINLRFGRVNIPFGEEYQHRSPLLDPLVTHSLSDIWGIDEGIEFYGELGHASYAFAVQNGSSKTMRDYNAEKALTLRVGYDVTPRLHVSASAMRTGKLQSADEPLSEVWIGNVVFRNIGSSLSTTHQADLAQVDAGYSWSNGHLLAAAGRARYRDNDPLADNTQHMTYYQVEGVQYFTHELYGAARFSALKVDHGYPLAGIGSLNTYYLTALRTKDLQRFSIGGGYRFNESMLLKVDYTFEDGTLSTGEPRDNHLVSFESAVGF